MITEQCFLKVD